MANSFITIKEIARAALPRLIENLVFPNLVHKDYSDTFVPGKGATIQVKKPVILEAKDFKAETGVEIQDIKEDSVEVTLDKLATVDIEVSAIEGAVNIDTINRVFIEPAAAALAQKINADGLALYKDIPYIAKGGEGKFSLASISDARRMLNENKVPVSPRRAVWSTKADADFTTVPAIVNAEKSGTTAALRDGSIGRIFGFENYMSQAVCAHVSGITAAEGLKVTKAVEAGANTLGISGTTLTGKFAVGDVLIIGGLSYVVTAESAAAASSAIASVSVYPALPALAANTVVEFVGAHDANLAFHPNAFAFVTRPLTTPSGVESYVTSYNGISLRVTKGYDMKYKKDMLSMDVLYGYKTMYPELAARVIG